MNHLDLFSGIGGFALAADMAWVGVDHTFCENDRFCQSILKKHWPDSPIYKDIKEFTPHERFDLVTGGFPCQPFSSAGKRRGTADDRHLWPEMLRVIRGVRPEWVIAENVSGLLTWDNGLVFEQVCLDLENEGYEVQPFVIPACAVNAPHRRDRVWVLGYSEHNGLDGSKERTGSPAGSNRNQARTNQDEQPARPALARPTSSDTESKRGEQPRYPRSRRSRLTNDNWLQDWTEVATQLCTVDDGLPNGVARPRGWRNAALKAAGNAIVPQVAAQIMGCIEFNNP